MLDDGYGGAFITWKDYRNGLPDIYVQRFDSAGYPKWMGNGVVICNDAADQSTPAIVSDMRGGAIIAWSDWRSGVERDIYAQRIDSSGTVKWTINGANVSNLSPREHSEKIVSDGKGGVIIVFEKQSGLWDIWAQRLDSSGNKMWGPGGIAVSTASGNKRNHKVQKDKSGGAIITWQDLRNGSHYDIYAQRLDAAGNRLWGGNGIAVCSAGGDQTNAKIEPDSSTNGAYIAWQDTRSSVDYDIYMQRVDSSGNIKWVTDGIAVSTATDNQSALDMLSFDGGHQLIITWKDKRNGNYDIYAQKLNSNGALQWNPSGVVVCNSNFDQINPNISKDEYKGAIIVWQDSSAGPWDIKAQRVNNAGQALWTPNGEPICNALFAQTSPKNVSDGKGGGIFAWEDLRSGETDLYIHHFYKTPLSVEDVSPSPIVIFPNPVRHHFTIQYPHSTLLSLRMTNVLGQEIPLHITNISPERIDVELPNQTEGMYMVQLQSSMGRWSQRIMATRE